MDPAVNLKRCLQVYKDKRQQLIKKIQDIINVRNQLTYVSVEALEKASTTTKSSRVTFKLHEKMAELSSELHIILSELSDSVIKLKEITMTVDSKNCKVDVSCIEELLSGIEQQYTLENSITESILNASLAEIDQDSLTTMIACFEYPPYLVEARLDALLTTI